MRLTMGKVITLGDSNDDEHDLMSKEMLEEMVKKRLKEVVVAKWGSIKRVDNLDNLGGQPGTAVRDTIKVRY